MTDFDPHTGRRIAGPAQGWALIAIGTLPTLAIVSLVPNLPQLFQHFAAVPGHEIYVPMIITMPSLCIAIFGPLAAGPLADLWGRRRLLLVALCAYTILGLAPLLFDSLFAIIASRAVVGLAEAAILTAGNALLGDYFAGEDRQKWLGYQTVVGPIAASLLILAGGVLGDRSWNAPFALYLLAAPILLWSWFAVWEPTRAAGATPAERAVATPFPWRATLFVAAATIGTSLAYYVQALQLGRIFSELGVSTPSRISLIITVASVGVVIGGYLYRRLSHLPISRVFAVILLAIGVGYVGLGLAHDYRAGLLFGVIAQFGNGLAIPALIAWALSKYTIDNRGRGMGIWGGCFFVGQFLSPLALSAVGSFTSGFMQTVVVIGVLCIVAALIAFTVRSEPVAASAHH